MAGHLATLDEVFRTWVQGLRRSPDFPDNTLAHCHLEKFDLGIGWRYEDHHIADAQVLRVPMGNRPVGQCDTMCCGDMVAKGVLMADYITETLGVTPRRRPSARDMLSGQPAIVDLFPEAEGREEIVEFALRNCNGGRFSHAYW